jgi:diacylglycerol kinase (ATP)
LTQLNFMKSVTVFHNPTAGSETHSKKELIALIEKHGYDCRYYSTKKKGYKNFKKATDLLVAAGGDGTVGKALKRLITRKLDCTIAVLPLGTANNISRSLGIKAKIPELIKGWETARTKQFNFMRTSGDISGVCFESVGLGVFTELILKIKNSKKDPEPEEKLKFTLACLREVVATYQAKEASIVIDQKSYSGKFIWIEAMNICSIGPNIIFSPTADPSDGLLNIVLVEEDQRGELMTAIERKISGIDHDFTFKTIKATKVDLYFDDSRCHVDDQVIDMGKPIELSVEVDPQVFTFLV